MTWLISLIHIHWILIYPVGSAIQRLIVIVIACLPTKHIGVHMNSFKRVRAFQIELEFGSVGFWGDGKPEYPEKNLSEQGREPTTNSTHIWRRRRELNPGHIGGRRALSPLRHRCSPEFCNPGLVPIHWFTTAFLLFSLLPFLIL